MTSIHPCYTCDDPIEPSDKKFVATFHGKNRDICETCAFGIFNGSNVLRHEGVEGEYLGPCGDNSNPEQP